MVETKEILIFYQKLLTTGFKLLISKRYSPTFAANLSRLKGILPENIKS